MPFTDKTTCFTLAGTSGITGTSCRVTLASLELMDKILSSSSSATVGWTCAALAFQAAKVCVLNLRGVKYLSLKASKCK